MLKKHLLTLNHYTTVSMPIKVTADEATIRIQLTITKSPTEFLLDNGSSASLINCKFIKNGTKINRTKKIEIEAATGHIVNSIAAASGSFTINNNIIAHEFHMYHSDILPIKYDGILGHDFFFKYKCDISIMNEKLYCHIPATETNRILEIDTVSNVQVQENKLYLLKKPFYLQENYLRKKHPFDFVQKIFTNKIYIQSSFEKSKIYLYLLNKSCNQFDFCGRIPALTTKQITIDVPMADGSFLFKTKNILPNVSIADSLVSVKQKKVCMLIRNKNNFQVDISNDLFSAKDFENILRFHIFNISTKIAQKRESFIGSNIDLNQCNTVEKASVLSLCKEFNDCFFLEDDRITHTDIITHSIELKSDAKPSFIKQYKLPESQKDEIQRQINRMEMEGVIEKCPASGWNSPIIIVPKRDENGEKTNYRLVVDFRRLNEATVPIQFPIPQIDSIINQLTHSKLFSILDLHSAFYQIKLDTKSRSLTTFQNNNFSYRFLSMPMGLCTSPSTMQQGANLLFDDLLNKGVNIYLDDIIVYSKTFSEHLDLLREVFSRLRKHNFKLKPNKCKFLQKEVEYLGYIINENGSRPNPLKTKCINDFPTPKNVVETQRFLGLCNYYRKYIRNYAEIARPIYNLLKKDCTFVWSDSCEKAFGFFKEKLSNPPILIFPDFSQQFIITTDASNCAVGAVLSQGQVPNDKPIQYASKVLTAAQKNYSTIEKELYAIIFGIETFRHYVFGYSFTLYTDHKPLTYIFNFKNPSSRLYRWKLFLSEYNFKIIYRKGTQNCVADALSRIEYVAHDLSDILQSTSTTNILTRSKDKERIQNALNASGASSPDLCKQNASYDFYEIEEKNDILTDSSVVHHIFYFFESENCELRRKLEYKHKANIELPSNIVPFIPYSIDENKTIFVTPIHKIESERIEQFKLLFSTILDICNNKNYAEIAVNFDIKSPKLYFEFKHLYKQIFKLSNIKTQFFLSKILYIYDMDHILEILNTYHNSSIAGHCSFEKTKNAIKRYYSWPTLNKDIKNFVSNCQICRKSKIARHTKSPMVITSTSDFPFQKVYIDFVIVEKQYKNKYPCIFTCVDELTKYAVAIKARDCTAITAAKKFVKHVVLKYNIPEAVVSDRGSAFLSETFSEITKLFKIKKITTTPYRPNSNIVERFHRSLSHHLITCVHSNPTTWDENIHCAVFAYNNAVNSATGFSPHELIFGFNIQLPDKIIKNTSPVYNYDSYKEELRNTLKTYWQLAKNNINQRKIQNKEYRDKKANPLDAQVGDLVFLEKPFKEHKYGAPYEGPFTITDFLSPVTAKIKNGNKTKTVHTDKLIKA
jgi:transposase InsO family protein